MIKQFNECNEPNIVELLFKYRISREEYFKNDISDNKKWLFLNKKEKNIIPKFKPVYPSLNKVYYRFIYKNIHIEIVKIEDDYYYVGLTLDNKDTINNQYYKLDQFSELKHFFYLLKKYNNLLKIYD